MRSARYTVYGLLMKAENGAYSNIALNSALSDKNISRENKKLISRLFYGVTERKLTLDHVISQYSKKPAEKLDREVLTALRMGLYQLLYCDGIPESAAVSESVNIVKQAGKSSASGFVNGVLRGFIRNGMEYMLPDGRFDALSVKYSCNKDIIKLLIDGYGEETAVSVLEASFSDGKMTARANTVRTDAEGLIRELEKDGFKAGAVGYPADGCAVEIISGGAPDASSAYKKGLFHIQDISSQLCCMAAAPEENDTVLDVCAAPGGKTFTMAEMMHGRGKIIACELHENRAGLIKKGAERLGLSNISVICRDSSVYDPDMPMADKVLCDVPCSGLGVMRDKPEIKYKSAADFSGLPELQYNILETSSHYVKSGGTLVYSTCTLNPAENSGVADKFLSENPNFYGAPFMDKEPFGGYSVTVLPKYFGSDGFYICRMMKK